MGNQSTEMSPEPGAIHTLCYVEVCGLKLPRSPVRGGVVAEPGPSGVRVRVSIPHGMTRREKASAWAKFIGMFAVAFLATLAVGLMTHSLSAANSTFFLTLPAIAFVLLRIVRRTRPERVPRYGWSFYGAYAVMTACLVAGQITTPVLAWGVAPAIGLVLFGYLIRRERADPDHE